MGRELRGKKQKGKKLIVRWKEKKKKEKKFEFITYF